jgi:hypothetical protein
VTKAQGTILFRGQGIGLDRRRDAEEAISSP